MTPGSRTCACAARRCATLGAGPRAGGRPPAAARARRRLPARTAHGPRSPLQRRTTPAGDASPAAHPPARRAIARPLAAPGRLPGEGRLGRPARPCACGDPRLLLPAALLLALLSALAGDAPRAAAPLALSADTRDRGCIGICACAPPPACRSRSARAPSGCAEVSPTEASTSCAASPAWRCDRRARTFTPRAPTARVRPRSCARPRARAGSSSRRRAARRSGRSVRLRLVDRWRLGRPGGRGCAWSRRAAPQIAARARRPPRRDDALPRPAPRAAGGPRRAPATGARSASCARAPGGGLSLLPPATR